MSTAHLHSFPEGDSDPQNAASARFSRLGQLAIIVAHEDRNSAQIIKDILCDLNISLQIHRVTSLDDLGGSLQVQDWDIVCSFSHSSEFDPQQVCSITQTAGNGASIIYIDTGDDHLQLDTLLEYGYNDHLAISEPTKILNSIYREALAARNARLVNSNLELIEEYNRKNALLLDASSDAIAYVADGMVMHGNQAFVDLLALDSLDDLVWQSFIDFVSDESQDAFKAALRGFRRDPENTNSVKTALLGSDQTSIEVNVSFASASHEGEQCTQLVIREIREQQPNVQNSPEQNNSPAHDNASIASEKSSDNTLAQTTHAPEAAPYAWQGEINTESIKQFTELAESDSPKGHLICVHLSMDTLFSANESLENYSLALTKLATSIEQETSEATLQISPCNWLVALPEEDSTLFKAFAENLITQINTVLTSCELTEASSAISIGASPYGVADIDALEAVSKAHSICADKVSGAGGYAAYQPRISDSSSSSALISALELDRLKIKYQPIIALQGQTIHLYEASLYLVQDDNLERSAHNDMLSLGVEEENTGIDKWFFNNVLDTLKEAATNDTSICVNIPITASGIVHKDFFPDIMLAFDQSGLPKSCVSFSANIEVAKDYPEKTVKLFSLLRQAGFNTSLENVNQDHLTLVSDIKPCFVNVDPNVSNDKTDENWRMNVRTILDAAKSAQAQCIICNVISAADLAQIWQCGAPFVKGSYLQEPITGLTYEFSELS